MKVSTGRDQINRDSATCRNAGTCSGVGLSRSRRVVTEQERFSCFYKREPNFQHVPSEALKPFLHNDIRSRVTRIWAFRKSEKRRWVGDLLYPSAPTRRPTSRCNRSRHSYSVRITSLRACTFNATARAHCVMEVSQGQQRDLPALARCR